jgi:hypothetical protein
VFNKLKIWTPCEKLLAMLAESARPDNMPNAVNASTLLQKTVNYVAARQEDTRTFDECEQAGAVYKQECQELWPVSKEKAHGEHESHDYRPRCEEIGKNTCAEVLQNSGLTSL